LGDESLRSPQVSDTHEKKDSFSMKQLCRLENPIQYYAWGSHESIARLQGRVVPSESPEAELWMGAHPKAPSWVAMGAEKHSLLALMQYESTAILGTQVDQRFAGRLPFLLKVLAASKPLSIQAHPNLEQARAGFARENALGIPFDAWDRSYRDDNHKPELICAITPFWALRGFRPYHEILGWIEHLRLDSLHPESKKFAQQPNETGLRTFYSALLTLLPERKAQLLTEARRGAQRLCDQTDDSTQESARIGRWILQLHDHYPDDIGILSPALLHTICLQPGQAMYLPDGELHAYLEGTGIEIMANSDNVLRGGLTNKHIDIPELLRVLRFAPTRIELLTPQPNTETPEAFYSTPNEEFSLSVLHLLPSLRYTSPSLRSAEIWLCLDGSAEIKALAQPEIRLTQGDAILVPADAPPYQITGHATLYKATTPLL